jgi:hypothetical protein
MAAILERLWPTRDDPGPQKVPNHRWSDSAIQRATEIHKVKDELHQNARIYKVWASGSVFGVVMTALQWKHIPPFRRGLSLSVLGLFVMRSHWHYQQIVDGDARLVQLCSE